MVRRYPRTIEAHIISIFVSVRFENLLISL
jgi:hypothetical protein